MKQLLVVEDEAEMLKAIADDPAVANGAIWDSKFGVFGTAQPLRGMRAVNTAALLDAVGQEEVSFRLGVSDDHQVSDELREVWFDCGKRRLTIEEWGVRLRHGNNIFGEPILADATDYDDEDCSELIALYAVLLEVRNACAADCGDTVTIDRHGIWVNK